jgi:ribosome recycling factor
MSFTQVFRRAGLPLARRNLTAISPALTCCRFYASRTKSSKDVEKTKNRRAPVSTDTLIPGSKLRISGDAQQEYGKCEGKMKAAIEWYRKEVASLEDRAVGRVTPALVSSVRVTLPNRKDSSRLEEIATVGVKDGSTLIITVFEDDVSIFIFRLFCRTLTDS